jgi:hypothetical protein
VRYGGEIPVDGIHFHFTKRQFVTSKVFVQLFKSIVR